MDDHHQVAGDEEVAVNVRGDQLPDQTKITLRMLVMMMTMMMLMMKMMTMMRRMRRMRMMRMLMSVVIRL